MGLLRRTKPLDSYFQENPVYPASIDAAACRKGKVMDLHDVLITPALQSRKSRQLNGFAERRGLDLVARRASFGRQAVLEALCEFALETCRADFAGISVRYETEEEAGFAWEVLAGVFENHIRGKVPLDSPCGVCLERGLPQLFSHPERHYEWMREAGFVISEVLVVPMYSRGRTPMGTLWIVQKDDGRHFDQEDARVMAAMGKHASAALQIPGKNSH
jgi:hypothetical protein